MHKYNKNALLCWEQLLYQQLKQTGTISSYNTKISMSKLKVRFEVMSQLY